MIKLSKQKTQKLTTQDLFKLKIIQEPQISPNGEEILFTLKSFNPEKNEYTTSIYLIPYSGNQKAMRPFTQGSHDGHPRYSPDGSQVSFLRKVGDYAQVFVSPRHGGEPKQVTHYKNSFSEIVWSPDGTKLALTASIKQEGLIPETQKEEEESYKKYNQDVKVIDRLWHKLDGRGFVHNQRSQIFILDLALEEVKQLTFGEHEASAPCFSPDGKSIVFSSNRNKNCDEDLLSLIYLVPISGGESKCLTPGRYLFNFPSFSPDGKWIAFIGTDETDNWYANPHLWIISAQGEKLQCLTKEFDRPVSDHSINDLRGFDPGETPVWGYQSDKIYLSMSDCGKTSLISVELKNKAITNYAEGNHVIFAWSISQKTEKAVVAQTNPTTPNDLWSLDLKRNTLSRITEINAPFWETFIPVSPEHRIAKSADGTSVEGWILKPADFEEGKKYPCILEIHGGPMAMYAWSYFFEFQLLANHGYVVVYSNPRGSIGYGQSFCEVIQGDWGNRDYQDIMAFLDQAISEGFIDESRLGVAGGSYGGFMTNWIVGHTNRFKAGITMRSVTNEHSFYGTSDYGFMGEMNLGCLPWEKPEVYLKYSPLSYVKNIKTPLLILHAEEDYRCPIEQAEQLYVALKKLHQETLFIRFPGESHDMSRTGKPWHRIYRLDQILAWFDKHLKK